MADRDPHTVATIAYAHLQRDPAFRRAFPNLRNVFVCVESDLLDDVQRLATQYFPDGGEIACYFPDRKRIKFARHAGRGKFTTTGEVLDSAPGQTIGMVVDLFTTSPDWIEDGVREFSTRDVEKALPG
ncbi:hypothetical protein QN239_29290 [Mycolicibacterium sp. Y3]